MKKLLVSLFVLGLLGFVPQVPPQANVMPAVQANTAAAHEETLTLDVAADCRTVVLGLNRGDTNMVTGKIFPGGTLPSGAASNDPTLPVNGVAPIGDWHHRSQTALPLPPDIAPAYSSAPPVLATFYFLFDDGRALTTENWGVFVVDGIPTVLGAVTGGFGGFSGATGELRSIIIGTNATGCPNGRTTFTIRR